MLENYFVKAQTIERIRRSWIAESIEKYVASMEAQGYANHTIQLYVERLVCFGEYAKSKGANSLADISAFTSDFASDRASQCSTERKDNMQRRTKKDTETVVKQMLAVVLPEFKRQSHKRRTELPRFDFTEKFFVFLQEERGLSKASICVYEYSLGLFQAYVDGIGMGHISELSPAILRGFVVALEDRLSKASLLRVLGPVRVMLRYLFRERLVDRDLSMALESPRNYRLAGLPRAITWDEVGQMLATVDLWIPVGRRDYAILLLLVTYGLRAREVAAITLDDIDWKNEKLRIRERKAGHSAVYPLSTVVANAILEYLKKDRPKVSDRRLFCRVDAPKTPLSYKTIVGRARHHLCAAGIPVSMKGSHTLRHTCVQRLVDAQFSLKVIGDYIGHRSPESTRIYSKVDIKSLSEISSGLEEGLI